MIVIDFFVALIMYILAICGVALVLGAIVIILSYGICVSLYYDMNHMSFNDAHERTIKELKEFFNI